MGAANPIRELTGKACFKFFCRGFYFQSGALRDSRVEITYSQSYPTRQAANEILQP